MEATTSTTVKTPGNDRVRLFSKDVQRILNQTQQERCNVRLPADIYSSFKQIEQLIREYKNKPEQLDIDIPGTIGLPPEIIEEYTCKVFELCEMIDHADDNSYQNHLSYGSLFNVGMSTLRRCFYVSVQLNQSITQQKRLRPNGKANPCPYPYIEVEGGLLDYLENLFLRIYKFKLTKPLIPLFVMGCLQLCCYTRFVGFNCEMPMDNVGWRTIYDSVFLIVQSSKIPVPKDNRYWIKH